MATTLSTWLAAVRTTIAALVPTTATPSATFTVAPGLLSLAQEAEVADRMFEVAAVDGGGVDNYMNAALVGYLRPFEVRVRYDHLADEEDAQTRVLEDELKIANALITRANWTANVQHVSYGGARREVTAPQFSIMTLTFEAACLESL